MIGFARKFLLLVPIALIVGFGFRPTPILGVDGKSLAASVGVPVGTMGFEPCVEEGETWNCVLPGANDSSADAAARPVAYTIDVDGLGCWTGTVRGSGSKDAALDGCVTIADHVKAID